MPERHDLHVAVVGRSVYALHGYGGLERHLFDLIRYHLDDGMRVTLVTRPPDRPDGVDPGRWALIASHPRFTATFVRYDTFPLAGRRGTTIADRSTAYPWFGWRAGRAAGRLVALGDAHIVYGVGASLLGYARDRRRGASAPMVLNPQGLEEFGGPDGTYGGAPLKALGYAPLRRAVRYTAAAADAVIATDQSLLPVVARHLPVPASGIRLVPNGLDVADGDRMADAGASLALRASVDPGADGILLVSAGRLEANKGFGDAAEALRRAGTSTRWKWVIVGEGPARRTLETILERTGLGARVVLTGRVDDRTLHAWLGAADLFVHPTRYEGSSLVTLEAMLHRKPVVATRTGGLPDKVKPGETGWLAAPADPDSLAAALTEAFAARHRWPAIGDAGRALLERTFDWHGIQRQYRSLYEELAQAPAAAALSAEPDA